MEKAGWVVMFQGVGRLAIADVYSIADGGESFTAALVVMWFPKVFLKTKIQKESVMR
jgi:hypothetical protein